MVFNDGLSKSAMVAMADGITSTDNLPPYILDRLFYSYSNESLSDVGKLSDQARCETDSDSGSIFNGYSDVSDDESDGVNAVDELRTV